MSNHDKVYEQARVAFKRLTLNKGDVVTVTLPPDIDHSQMALLAHIMQPLAIEHEVSVVFLTDGVTVDTLSEHEMNEMGWFRFNPKQPN